MPLSKLKLPLRAGFALIFFGLESLGIYRGLHAPDRAFGFQMFNESSRTSIKLFREVAGKKHRELVELPDGRWQAPDATGTVHDFAWTDKVRTSQLTQLGQSVHARYGLDAQLFRLQAALDYVVRHIPEDSETRALVAEVETVRNGQPEPLVRLRADRP